MDTRPVIIAGAGIAGLSIAYELQKKGIPYEILEAGSRTGGLITSLHKDGYELDAGPNSLAASQDVLAFIREIGLENEMMEASAVSKNRFLVRNNQLHAISPHPLKIIKSKYVSGSAKWRLFTEQFRKSKATSTEESVTSFVTRRFGAEIAEYLFEPVLSGIYAGNPDLLSIQEVLPMLPKWEKEYGSVTKGLMKNKQSMGGRKIIAFKGGNQALPNKLAALLTGRIRLNCAITGIVRDASGYIVQYNENGTPGILNASRVIFTTPAYTTAALIQNMDPVLAGMLNGIHYPHMGVLHLAFGEEALEKMPAGFGFLVPHAAGKHFLGAICNSAIFPSRAPQGKVLFTIFVGGAMQEHLFKQMDVEHLQQQIIKEFMEILQLQQSPVFQLFSEWKKAIPQLNVGFAQIREQIRMFEERYPGIRIAGNYVTGVAVPAIIQAARQYS